MLCYFVFFLFFSFLVFDFDFDFDFLYYYYFFMWNLFRGEFGMGREILVFLFRFCWVFFLSLYFFTILTDWPISSRFGGKCTLELLICVQSKSSAVYMQSRFQGRRIGEEPECLIFFQKAATISVDHCWGWSVSDTCLVTQPSKPAQHGRRCEEKKKRRFRRTYATLQWVLRKCEKKNLVRVQAWWLLEPQL